MGQLQNIMNNLYRARASGTTFRGPCAVCGKECERTDLRKDEYCGAECLRVSGYATRFGSGVTSAKDELKKVLADPNNAIHKTTRVQGEYPWSPADPDGSLRRSGVIKRYQRPPSIK